MKKSLTYTTIAVLLGVALMFAPFLTLPTGVQKDTYAENFRTLPAKSESFAGVTPHYPTDALSVGLMLTFSLAFALIASSQFRRKEA